MRRLFLAFVLLAFASGSAMAQGTVYRLGPESDHEMGCFGPCACPVLIQSPMTGTFRMQYAGPGEAEERYQITEINWEVFTQDGVVHVTGSGIYRIFWGTTPSQATSLNLSIDGSQPLPYFSPVEPITVPWPAIQTAVSRHQAFCWDTLFTVSAAPATAGIVPANGRARLATPFPSPFRDRVDLAFTLPATGPVELTVFAASGRRVRTLVDGTQEAGPHTATWDGRDERGRPVSAGVLFVRLRTAFGFDQTTLVRIR